MLIDRAEIYAVVTAEIAADKGVLQQLILWTICGQARRTESRLSEQ